MKKSKTFDCVDMKRKGAEQVQQEIAGMSIEQELAYWRKGTEELRTLKDSRRKTKGTNGPSAGQR